MSCGITAEGGKLLCDNYFCLGPLSATSNGTMTRKYVPSAARTAAFIASVLVGPFLGVASAVSVPGDYPTIQSAIDAVINGSLADGTTIDVQPGTYAEALYIANTARSFTVRSLGATGSAIIYLLDH